MVAWEREWREPYEAQLKQAKGVIFEIPKNSYPFDCNRP
jgi:hypothetical protein